MTIPSGTPTRPSNVEFPGSGIFVPGTATAPRKGSPMQLALVGHQTARQPLLTAVVPPKSPSCLDRVTPQQSSWALINDMLCAALRDPPSGMPSPLSDPSLSGRPQPHGSASQG
ncbi:hypothetical protein N7462_002155 [Penicillium macrosclerotiorum]|uniref:uncharacterized protein n=1 Tax=Penicillium macrosclerotiorum TaxID=303699 RepID=UPI002547F613|nr:uncharacterized protein N7462_002155 [Penicillium macrosclerotiorum]KAJ5692732.1 hypothetical protein N7462_002155 [Penicillium macrosclerotiorum]